MSRREHSMDASPIQWRVRIPDTGVRALHDRLLGLTFVERRLREARRWSVPHVQFVVPEGLSGGIRMPRMRAPERCAPWSLVSAEEADDGADPAEGAYDVELFAIIDDTPPYRTRLSLPPQGDWRPAIRWHKQRIIAKSGAGWVGKTLNKPISLALSTALARTPITPNQWSSVNMLVGLASAWLVAQPGYGAVLAGGLLFQLASIFDGVDGELATFRLESSPLGAWVDTAVDNLSLLAFFAGCGVHVLRYSGLEPADALMLSAVCGAALVGYLAMQMLFVRHRLNEGSLVAWDKLFLQTLPRTDPVVWAVLKARHFFKKDFFSAFFFLVCALGQVGYLFHLVTVGGVLMFATVGYLNVRYWSLADEGMRTTHL